MVRISGAVGIYACPVNGFYQPTDEIVGNASVYKQLGDDEMCIEYNLHTVAWIVRGTEHKGTTIGLATCEASPPLPLEQCPLSSWAVIDVSSFVKQSSLSVSVTTMAAFQAYEDAKVVLRT